MTDDELEAMFHTSLNGHADEAVDTGGRGAAAHAGVRRRRRVILGIAAAAAVVLLVPAAVVAVTLGQGSTNVVTPTPSTGPPTSRALDSLPPDWRWESFHGLEVGVPAAWTDGSSTSQLTTQWCIGKPRGEGRVGRPGASTLVGCPGFEGGPDPGLQIENAGRFLAFDTATDAPDGSKTEGDRTTVTRDGVSVLVQAEPNLREQIVSTLRPADPDSNGCPATDPISNDPSARPDPAVDITTLTDITAVTACRYVLQEPGRDDPSGLISSTRLSEDEAVQAVSAVAAVPAGGGPDDPQTCTVQVSYGEEIVVLRIQSAAGESSVYMRFSGCDHNGFDDGVAVRALTVDTAPRFLAGPNTPTSASGSREKLRILFGPDEPR